MSAALMAVLIFVSCKPTEQGYKAAYDSALEKREAAMREQMIPATGLLSDDGPQIRVVKGDTVFVLRETLRRLDGERNEKGWSVAVGKYKMETNAVAQAEDLRRSGIKGAFAGKSRGDAYWTLIGNYSTLDSAVNMNRKFQQSHRGYPYIGLPGAPVVIGY